MTPSPHPHIDEAYKPKILFLQSYSVAKVNSLPLNIFKFKYITLVYSWKDFTLAAQITRPARQGSNSPPHGHGRRSNAHGLHRVGGR